MRSESRICVGVGALVIGSCIALVAGCSRNSPNQAAGNQPGNSSAHGAPSPPISRGTVASPVAERYAKTDRLLNEPDITLGITVPFEANYWLRGASAAHKNQLITGGWNNKLTVWDTESGRVKSEFGDELFHVEQVQADGQGKFILTVTAGAEGHASMSTSPVVKLWEGATGRLLWATSGGYGNMIESAAISPDGKFILVAKFSDSLELWSTIDLQQVATFKLDDIPYSGIRFTEDSSKALVACSSGRVYAVSPQSRTCSQVGTLPAGPDVTVTDWDLSPDGTRLVYLTWRAKEVRLLTTDNWQSDTILGVHKGQNRCVRFSRDGNSIVSGDDDGRVSVWDVGTMKEKAAFELDSGIGFLEFSADNRRLFAAANDTVFVRDTSSWAALEFKSDATRLRPSQDVSGLEFSADGAHLLSWSSSGEMIVWDILTQASLLRQKFSAGLASLEFTQEGRGLLGAGFDKAAHQWDAISGKEIAKLPGHPQNLVAARGSPDGKTILTVCADATLRLWDAQSYELLRTIGTPQDVKRDWTEWGIEARHWEYGGPVHDAQFFTNGQRALADNGERGITIWNLDPSGFHREIELGNKPHTVIRSRRNDVFALLGSTGQAVVVDGIGEVYLCALPNHKARKVCEGLNGTGERSFAPVAALSPSGKYLAGLAKEWWDKGQEERPIDCFVWEIPSGDEFLRIKTSATAMAFSPDGSTLAIADDHRRIHLWKLPRK